MDYTNNWYILHMLIMVEHILPSKKLYRLPVW